MENRKTLYSVDYKTWGSDITRTRWFDNKDAATEFANQDYHDDPVAHNFKLDRANEIMEDQRMEDAYYIAKEKELFGDKMENSTEEKMKVSNVEIAEMVAAKGYAFNEALSGIDAGRTPEDEEKEITRSEVDEMVDAICLSFEEKKEHRDWESERKTEQLKKLEKDYCDYYER